MPGDQAVDKEVAMRLLIAAVADDPQGKAGVARRLKCSRTLLARIFSERSPVPLSTKLARRIIDAYHIVPFCPGTGAPQLRSECQRLASAPAPMHNPGSMRIWRACRTCPYKPTPHQS